jgi:hypothetical protein
VGGVGSRQARILGLEPGGRIFGIGLGFLGGLEIGGGGVGCRESGLGFGMLGVG